MNSDPGKVNKIKLLHVDDSDSDIWIFKEKIKNISSEVMCDAAYSVSEAKEIIGEKDFDCILCDYQMPGENGLALLKWLRSRDESTPFIFLTGQGSEQIAVEALRSGANDYFIKDFGIAFYERILGSILNNVNACNTELHRREAEEALKHHQRLLLEAQSVAQLGYYVWDATTGLWTSSEILDQIFEIDEDYPKDVEGWLGLVHPKDREMMQEYLGVYVVQQGEVFDKKYRIQTKEGKIKWVHGLGRLKKDDSGNVLEMLGTIRDITSEKESQYQLVSKDAWLNNLFHSVPFGLGIVRNRKFLDVNDHFCEVTKWERKELINKHAKFLHLNDENEEKLHQAFMKGVKEKGFAAEKTQILSKDGEVMDVKISVSPIEGEGPDMKLAFALVDITEYEKLRAQIEQEKRISSFIIEGTNAATWQWNAQTGETIHNDRWSEIIGYSAEEFKNRDEKSWVDHIHPEDRDKIAQNIEKHFNGQTDMIQAKVRIKHEKGHWVWVHIRGKLQTRTSDGKPEWSYGANTDITEMMTMIDDLNNVTQELKNANSDLILQKQRLTNIIQGTQTGTWEWNVQTGETIFNDRWAEIIGYSLEELNPISIDTWNKICHPDDLIESGNLLQKHFDGESDFYETELRMKHKDGHWVWVLDRGSVISRTDDGKPLLMMGTHQDISERKKADERLLESKKELERINAELESFSYTVSHDLKSPIRHIIGFTELLQQNYKDALDSEGQNILHAITEATMRLHQLVDDILSLSRASKGDLNPVEIDLTALVKSIAEELQNDEPERQVEIKIERNLKAIGDESLLAVVFENLLGNAWKFTSKTKKPVIDVYHEKTDGETVYCVRDNGVGFEPTDADKLFKPFKRLHSNKEFKGTGIGLSTVKKIIERHGGRVWTSAKPDEGAIFYFTLKQN